MKGMSNNMTAGFWRLCVFLLLFSVAGMSNAASSNANLAGLYISTGTLSPTFDSATTDYTVAVGNATTAIMVYPVVAEATATVKVNGTAVASGYSTGPISLAVGSNTITTTVTAGDGTTTMVYTITVTRAAISTDARLSGLVLSSGSLSPAFASGTTEYTSVVAASVSSITVTPTVLDAGATVKVNGAAVTSGNASASIPLAVGNTLITTVVLAADGLTTKTYHVTVTRPAVSTAWTYLNLTVPGVNSLPPILDMGTAQAQAYLPGMLNTMSQQLNRNLSHMQALQFIGQASNGAVMVGSIDGVNWTFMPLSYNSASSFPGGFFARGNGQFDVTTNGTSITIAPAVYSLNQLLGLIGGAIVNIDANGTIYAATPGAIFVVRPSYQVQVLSATGSPSLVMGGDGYFHFTDAAGFSQALYPAFLDQDVLRRALASLSFVTSAMQVEQNGTVTVQVFGNRYVTLIPDIALGAVPAEHVADVWWQEGADRYRIQNQLYPGTSQGFTVR